MRCSDALSILGRGCVGVWVGVLAGVVFKNPNPGKVSSMATAAPGCVSSGFKVAANAGDFWMFVSLPCLGSSILTHSYVAVCVCMCA